MGWERRKDVERDDGDAAGGGRRRAALEHADENANNGSATGPLWFRRSSRRWITQPDHQVLPRLQILSNRTLFTGQYRVEGADGSFTFVMSSRGNEQVQETHKDRIGYDVIANMIIQYVKAVPLEGKPLPRPPWGLLCHHGRVILRTALSVTCPVPLLPRCSPMLLSRCPAAPLSLPAPCCYTGVSMVHPCTLFTTLFLTLRWIQQQCGVTAPPPLLERWQGGPDVLRGVSRPERLDTWLPQGKDGSVPARPALVAMMIRCTLSDSLSCWPFLCSSKDDGLNPEHCDPLVPS